MIIRATFKSLRTLSIASTLIAAAMLSPTQAKAALDDTTTFSTLGCIAKNPKHRDFLVPNARGLLNRSNRVSVVVFCPIQRTHQSVVTCGAAQNHRFNYVAYFSLAPAVSGERPARMWAINTLPMWANEEAFADNPLSSDTPLPSVIMRGVSSLNPMDTWNGTSNYVTAITSLVMPCTPGAQEYAPTIRLQIPPKGYATAIKVTEFRDANNGT